MRIEAYYSHLNGREWLLVDRKGYWEQIEETISGINAEKCRTKRSKEQKMVGKMLFDPAALNKEFKKSLVRMGWNQSFVRYWVTDDAHLIRDTFQLPPCDQKKQILLQGKKPISSYNQTDFVKDRVAIEVQLGKYAFISYDLFVKHLAFYVGNQIDCGVEILPMKSMQSEMSSGPGYYEKALYDLVRQGRGVPAVPLVLIGIAP